MPLPSPEEGSGSAASLAGSFAAGGSEAFAAVYDTYAARLYTYAVGQLGSSELAADVVHDTLLLAHERIGQLRDPTKLTAWLYAICRNECNRQHRRNSRETATDEVPDVLTEPIEADSRSDAADASRLVALGLASLSARDREVMELALRHDLDASAIAEVLDISADNARARLSRARIVLEEGVAAALVLQAADGCDDLSTMRTLDASGDIEVTPLVRKRMTKHLRGCMTCQVSKSRVVKAIATVTLPLLVIPLWLRDSTLGDAQLTAAQYLDTSRKSFDKEGWPRQGGRSPLRVGAAAVGGAAVLLAGLALVNPPDDYSSGTIVTIPAGASSSTNPEQEARVEAEQSPASGSIDAQVPGRDCLEPCAPGATPETPVQQQGPRPGVAARPQVLSSTSASGTADPGAETGTDAGQTDTGPPPDYQEPPKTPAYEPKPQYTFKLPPVQTVKPYVPPKPVFTYAPPKLTVPQYPKKP